MPPKSKRISSKPEAEEVDEPLQAVVLTTDFLRTFAPLDLSVPRCLLPIANVPLLHYTLCFLAASGLREVYLYCSSNASHTTQIEGWIAASRWGGKTGPFEVLEVLRSTSRSVGDAMRDLDKRGFLSGDFVLCYGDLVANIGLGEALRGHRIRKERDKNSVMTVVGRVAARGHRSNEGDRGVWVLDGKGRVLAYEEMQGQGSKMGLDEEALACEELEIRTDLVDAGIDICTPDVLALWSDNFDYEVPRRGFLHSVLKDYELNGKKIHLHVEDDGYASRARDVRAYGAVTQDILGRWTYPLVPDANLVADQSFKLFKGPSCREEGVVLAGSCQVGQKTIIGRATAVGDGSVLKNSVVGRRCIIGRHVRMEGCYIWDDVTIGDGSVMKDTIIAAEASLGKKCTVRSGAIISSGCHVADGTVISERTRITRVKNVGDVEEEIVRGDTDSGVVGHGGEGFLYEDPDSDEDEMVPGLGPSTLYQLGKLELSQESISTIHSQEPSSEDHKPRTADSRATSFGSAASDDSHADGKGAPDFHHEASLSIYESLQKADESSNMQLELTALRMSADASPHAVRRAVVAAFMKRIAALMETGLTAAQAAKQTIPPHHYLLSKTMFDRGDRYDAKPDQVDFLHLMQGDLRHRKDGDLIMLHASFQLASEEILDNEGFEQWWTHEKTRDGEEMRQVIAKMPQFMDAIAEEESEEESDEEDE